VQVIDDEVGPGATFVFDVKNEGRGPAVDLRFSLITTAEATALPARHVLPIISPNAVEELRFHLSDRPSTESDWLLEIKYQDVARNDHKTGVLYSADLRVLRVSLPTIQTTYRARNLMRRRVRRA
jgi:hypothetical protein